MKKAILSSSLIISVLASLPSADTYLVHKTHTDSYNIAGTTVPAKDDKSTTWSCGDKICINSDRDTSTILRIDKKVLYIVYTKSKKYSEINLEELQKSLDQVKTEASNAIAPAGIPDFSSMIKFSAIVNPSIETKTINNWKCTKYQVITSMPMTTAITDMWTSSDIKIDYSNYAKMKNFAIIAMPGYSDMMKEYQKIKGFPVLSETKTKVMGNEIKSTEELTEASEKAAPAGIYDIPSDFKKINLK